MLLTNLYIQEDNGKIFRLSEKLSRMLFYFFLDMIIGVFLILCGKYDPPSNEFIRYSFYSSGVLFVLSGLILLSRKGYVFADKTKEKISVYIGISKLFFKTTTLRFSSVDCIMIEELPGSRSRYVAISIRCRDGRKILIDKTKNDLYVNNIVNKLKEYVGCSSRTIIT